MYQQRESTSSGQQGVSLQRAINRIRRSLDLDAILETTVEEVRACLGVDRVMLYQFHADASGAVVAETIRDCCLPPLLGLNFPADDIPQWARELYLKARQRSIVNVQDQQIGFSPLLCPENGEPLAVEDIYYRAVSPCHVEYLTAMGVQASLVVPILHYNQQQQQVEPQLWGLLVSHHAQPRSFKVKELRLVQQIADQAALAIAQATLLVQTQQQAQREAALNKITNLLHSLPKIQLQEALEETVQLLQSTGGRLYLKTDNHLFAQVYTTGKQPLLLSEDYLCPVEHHPLWQQVFAPEGIAADYSVRAIDDLTEEASLEPLSKAFQPQRLRSLLVIPLQYNQQLLGYLSVFRNETDTKTWWAGRFNPNQEQRQPRQSFAAWCEFKRGQVRSWQPTEQELAQTLQRQFSMAIQHHCLYEQVQTLNSSLERQVQQRTAELQQSLESAHVLRQVTDQIRGTLDYQLVLRTIVREVRSLLKTDRAVIYKFARNYQGTVVVEDVQADCISILNEVYDDVCFPLEYALKYRDKNRVSVVNDVERSDLHPCHIEFLRNLQVKSNLVVPIRIGSQLWGLLIVHECRAPRQWKETEITLLQQLAEQAEIAIKQAKLYQRSCTTAETAMKQAIRLQQALQDLKQTQTQLIHTEKMSSLGQLVAGVAHEINNPINFIHGNVIHAQSYMADLLHLVSLYQQGYTYTDPKVQHRIADMDLGFIQEDLPKLLSSMLLGSDRIRQIVLTLRNFSRLDEAQMKPVDIHDGIDSTLLILQNRLKAQPDHLATVIKKEYGDLPRVECYAGQLNQVFMNVINNAIDALHHHIQAQLDAGEPATPGAIVIATRQLDSDWVEVSIKDNGPGMDESVRSKLFDPFFTTKPVGEGTGLGLSISCQIVEKHGGKLICESASGAGAEFKIQIPIRQSWSKD